MNLIWTYEKRRLKLVNKDVLYNAVINLNKKNNFRITDEEALKIYGTLRKIDGYFMKTESCYLTQEGKLLDPSKNEDDRITLCCIIARDKIGDLRGARAYLPNEENIDELFNLKDGSLRAKDRSTVYDKKTKCDILHSYHITPELQNTLDKIEK